MMWDYPSSIFVADYLPASTETLRNSLRAFSSSREALRARVPAALLFSLEIEISKSQMEINNKLRICFKVWTIAILYISLI